MLWDVFIAVALCVVTIGMGYLGVHVSLHPTEEPRLRQKYKIAFVICAVVAVVLVVFQTIRNYISQFYLQQQLAQIERNTTAPPRVEVNVPAQAPPTVIVNNGGAKESPGVKLLFKESVPLTKQQKLQISGQVSALYKYLNSFGFVTPRETAPLSVIPSLGKGMFFLSTPPDDLPISQASINLAPTGIGDVTIVSSAYGMYAFQTIVKKAGTTDEERKDRLEMGRLMGLYFAADFLNKSLRDNPEKWLSALWEVRSKWGSQLTGASLFRAVEAADTITFPDTFLTSDFYFHWCLFTGLNAADGSVEKLVALNELLKQHGIRLHPGLSK